MMAHLLLIGYLVSYLWKWMMSVDTSPANSSFNPFFVQ
jgi:hypothetical protein